MKKSKGMQIGALLMAMLLLSMAFVPVVSAKADTNKNKGMPQQVLDLAPSPENYVILEHVQLTIWNKNHTTLSIHKKEANSGPQYFSIEVFPENKTYKTTKKEIKESPFLKQITDGQVKRAIDQKSKNNSENVVTASSYRTIQVAILSEDPATLDLAKTWHRLDFSADGSTVIYNYRLINGEAYITPWPFNTHWYIDITPTFYGSPQYSPDHYSVTSDGYGQYYNDDWNDQNLRTWAWHRIKIQGNADTSADVTASWDHWGEDAWLLHASYFTE
ncbi:MAG: hypothetical protein SCH70_11865 [Candidatus Methanoperedens sp.]|nr:hypothetical protein [Candidatus Methanoperedens sp.]